VDIYFRRQEIFEDFEIRKVIVNETDVCLETAGRMFDVEWSCVYLYRTSIIRTSIIGSIIRTTTDQIVSCERKSTSSDTGQLEPIKGGLNTARRYRQLLRRQRISE